MDGKKILALAQNEKKDERKQFNRDFALGSTGSFALIMMVILLGFRLARKENPADVLSLLSGTIAAYCYGKYLKERHTLWFILFILLILLCIFFFEKYL